MFEKTIPVPEAQLAEFADQKAQDTMLAQGVAGSAPQDAGAATLRAFDWNELTARLNAARDLRRVLRRDATGSIDGAASDFAGAAQRFLHPDDHSEPEINPVALEHCKSSPGMFPEQEQLHQEVNHRPGHDDKGVARED